jgi:hypothetical protein
MARQQSQGTCSLCKGTFPKASMTRHLTACLEAHDTAEKPPSARAKKGKLVRVLVEGKYQPQYWLHLELPATARMGDLDGFLRDIWLECCDHLSAFRIEGKKQARRGWSLADLMAGGAWGGMESNEVDMQARVGDVIEKGTKLSHEYDFGSTTELVIKGTGEREGVIEKPHEVRLLARNDPPHIPCGRCGQAEATIIDGENAYHKSGWLCPRCAEKEGLSEEEGTLPVVNSPRTGVCGYTGS